MAGSKLSKNFKTPEEAKIFADVLKGNSDLLFLSIQHTLVEAFFSIEPSELKAPGLNIYACQELYRPRSIGIPIELKGEPETIVSFDMGKWP